MRPTPKTDAALELLRRYLRSHLGLRELKEVIRGFRKIERERLEWHYLPDMPDDEVTVLLAVDGDVHEGYHDGLGWWLSNEQPAIGVYAWMHVPDAPER